MARSIQGSWWPTILQSDATATRGVRWRIVLLSWLGTAGLALLAMASIVTPLGLSDSIRPRRTATATATAFRYVTDPSAFGLGTPPRPVNPFFSRRCGDRVRSRDCPGRSSRVVSGLNATGEFDTDAHGDTIDSRVPENVTATFRSATEGTTVSGLFDIQYRHWFRATDPLVNNGSEFIRGRYRHLESLILHDRLEAVEGLVVDTQRGGVAYRNHTLPVNLEHGGAWKEDLLWLEPMTECVNTNLSIRFTLGNTSSVLGAVTDEYLLVDQGGFANLALDYPHPGVWNDTEGVPDLRARAYKAAWLSNAYSMVALNLTEVGQKRSSWNSTVGQTFPLGRNGTGLGFQPGPQSIKITQIDGGYLPPVQDDTLTQGNFSDAGEPSRSVELAPSVER